jgi:hypothetical protein
MRCSRPASRRVLRRISTAALVLALPTPLVAQDSPRIEQLNRAFLEHTRALGPQFARAAEALAQSRQRNEPDAAAENFVPDGLALLYPEFAGAMAAFDNDDFVTASERFAALRTRDDPYLAANAGYFYARCLVERGLLEETEQVAAAMTAEDAHPEQFTPYAAHLWFLRGFAQASNLRPAEATESLERVQRDFPDAPEAVRVGARQMLLELRWREVGTLDEIGARMGYAAGRLGVRDATPRVRERQDEAVALLDKLIQDAQDREQQQKSQSGRSGRSGGRDQRQSGPPGAAPREVSDSPVGPGGSRNLHGADKADPGEMWGKLPPAERERILQSLRTRFPSRYRELVEQYYRSLAEEK